MFGPQKARRTQAFQRAVPTTPADRASARVDCFPARTAFPKCPEGRHPHCHFRGLLRLHSRYGPSDRSAAQGDLCHEAPALPVTQPGARQLPDQSTILRVESSSTDVSRLRGARPTYGLPESHCAYHKRCSRLNLPKVYCEGFRKGSNSSKAAWRNKPCEYLGGTRECGCRTPA